MVYTFTEAEKKEIERSGLSVIEFKRQLGLVKQEAESIWEVLKEVAKKVSEAIRLVAEEVRKAFGAIRFCVDEMKVVHEYPTSRRYALVKTLSKCTGLGKRELWEMTRRSWLARDRC